MNKCRKCQTEFEGKFCPECGTKFETEKTCPQCGASVGINVRFCNNCGYKFEQEPSALQDGGQIQSGVTAKSAEQSAEKKTVTDGVANSSTSGTAKEPKQPFPIWKVLCKILPSVSKYAFALFALLLWAFFAAPFASFFGMSLGNVYSTFSEVFDDFLPIAQTAVAFGVIGFIYAAVNVALSFIPQITNKKLGKFSLLFILDAVSNLFYFVFFVLGCASAAKANEVSGESGTFAGVMIAFSLIFALFSAGAIFTDAALRKKFAEYSDAYAEENRLKAEKREKRLQLKEERKQNALKILAENNIVKPQKAEKPPKKPLIKLRRLCSGNFRTFYSCFTFSTLAATVSSFVFFGMTMEGSDVYVYDTYKLLALILFGVSVAMVVLNILLTKSLSKRCRLYRDGSAGSENVVFVDETIVRKRIKSNKTALIVCGLLGIVSSALFGVFFGLSQNSDMNGMLDVFCTVWVICAPIALLMMCLIPIFLVNYARGRFVVKAFGLNGINSPQLTAVTENGEVPLTLELLCRQKYDYDCYRRDLRLYKINYARAQKNKTVLDGKKWFSFVKTIKIAIMAAVIVVWSLIITVGFVSAENDIFRTVKLREISVGYSSKADVEKTLGKADVETEYVWAYYSDNYLNKLKEIERINEQIANAKDLNELQKLSERQEAVAKSMLGMEYKYIVVTFNADGKVEKTEYDFHAKVPSASQQSAVFDTERFLLRTAYCET